MVSAVIGTDLIAEMTKTRKWPCRGTSFVSW